MASSDEEEEKKKEKKAVGDLSVADHSGHTVHYAIITNSLVTFFKCAAFCLTGSASMLSEMVHSLMDGANQVMLAIGLQLSERKPDRRHPYGYKKEVFFWSSMSALSLMFLGCGVNMYHGISALTEGHSVANLEAAFVVLGVSGCLEGSSLFVALKAIKAHSEELNMPFWRYILYGPDPLSVAVFVEDVVAVGGLAVAGVALALSHVTGNAVYDAVGSIAIATGMGISAAILIQKNRHFLIASGLSAEKTNAILQVLNSDSAVKAVKDYKGEVMGLEEDRFKAEIDFDGEVVARKFLKAKVPDLRKRLKAIGSDHRLFEEFLVGFGAGVIDEVGREIDRLETKIRKKTPHSKHIDLEVD